MGPGSLQAVLGPGWGLMEGGVRSGTHADMQVLQEELQQAGAQAKCSCPLMTPRGLDPGAQVL